MAGNQVFIQDSDLYNRVGGQAALVQLLDPGKTGRWNTTISLLARTDACNFVLEAAGVQADLNGYAASEFASKFPNLVTYAALKAVALAWNYGSGGQAMPPGVARYDELANDGLELLATRKRKHGASDFSPQPAQAVSGRVDNDPHRDRMTLSSWKNSGFC